MSLYKNKWRFFQDSFENYWKTLYKEVKMNKTHKIIVHESGEITVNNNLLVLFYTHYIDYITFLLSLWTST